MYGKITKEGKIDFLSLEKKEGLVLLSNEDIDKLEKGCLYIDGEVIETDEYIKYILEKEKEKLKIEYKNIQKAIVDIKSEISEIEDTYETYNETGKMIADKQKTILNEKLIAFRQKKDTLVLGAIEKYGDEVLNEL